MIAAFIRIANRNTSLITLLSKRLINLLALPCWLLFILSCQHDQPLTPRSTDQIARLQEWSLACPIASTSIGMTGDSLTWIKIADAYYYITTATSSTFAYDSQQRLVSQRTSGYRNDTDYGRYQSVRAYTYTYSPTQLTVLREGNFKNGSYSYDSLSSSQYLPLNQLGLVTSQPQFEARYAGGDNGYSGISYLFSTSPAARVKDTLRHYDAEGYLIEATTVPDPGYDPWRLIQTIEAGNISGSYLTQSTTPTTSTEAKNSRMLNLFDVAKANIPNPHQFLGSASRNLMIKTIYYPLGQVPTSQTYRYEYDQKGRVERYFIHNSLSNKEGLTMFGRITYVN